ncbi:MAG: thiolase family protein [Lachnospiraceae bacterium]|nr:thiolase family protein [Lachnospiraceae bacterium]
MKEQRVFVTNVVRTAMGAPGKSLDKFMSSDLAAKAILRLLEKNNLDPLAVDQVVFGQSLPSTMPNNIGHFAWLKAELPVDVPGYTVHSNADSGLQALRNAYNLVAAGNEQIVLAGGADSYSAAPFVMRDVRLHFLPQDRIVIDSLDEAECCTQPEPMSRKEQFEKAHGEESEAAKAFRKEEEEKAAALAGLLGDELVKVSWVDRKKGEIVISADEWPGKAKEGPLSPNADCAAVTLAVSEEALEAKDLVPAAELLGFAVNGGSPDDFEKAGAEAVRKLLAKKELKTEDISLFEIAENSADGVLETAAGLNIPPEKINPFGGALAFGRCDGAEGILMLQRLLHALKPGEYGVIALCSAGGMGMAALLKKC